MNVEIEIIIRKQIKLTFRGIPTEKDDAQAQIFKILYENKHIFSEDKIYHWENLKEINIAEILSFIFADGERNFIICKNIIIELDVEERNIILDNFHNGKSNLHRGVNETLRRIREKYYWKNIQKDVENYVKSCEICNRT